MDYLISRAALLKECAECQKTDPRFEERGWASHFLNDAGEPSTEWYCVEDMIENAPTIDAIPLDWLLEKMRGYASALKSTELSAVVTVMSMWEKEQEAQNE